MASGSGEITLRDLLAWAPQLRLRHRHPAGAAGEDPLDNDVDWVVSTRASAPMLPVLRGGELILLPRRVVIESGVPFAMLLQELADRPVAGVLTDLDVAPTVDTPLPVLTVSTITSDLESEINRLLTSRRGDLLRTGADLEHMISEHSARNARPVDLIDAISRRVGLGMTIATENGSPLFSTLDLDPRSFPTSGGEQVQNGRPIHDHMGAPAWTRHPLRGDRVLWLGPIQPAQRALARLVERHAMEGIQRAFDQEDATAPRGAARARALNDLLLRPPADPAAIDTAAHRAHLPTGTEMRIALHPRDLAEDAAHRRLTPLGGVHDAGVIDGFTARVIASPHARPAAPLASPGQASAGWIAISAPILTARHLPQATRQARFVAALADKGLIRGADLRFDDATALGAWGLLFVHWGSPTLGRYVDQLLGDLIREDRRGLLRETLRAYLEHGGAQRPTAERLAIHRNTLTYRLRQIRNVLRLDPDDPDARLGLHLAILAADLPPTPPDLS